jgi:hypothetical protein
MSREAVLEQIHTHLQLADDDTLDNILYMLKHDYPMDDFDKKLMADWQAGKFDKLIANIDDAHDKGETRLLSDGLKQRS